MSSTNFNTLIKEYMAKMPDTLDTKKEIDEYYKTGCKDINDKIKEEKKEKKADKKKDGPTKRVKKVNVDEDGNEIEKVKRPPTEYQQFIRDTRPEVKEKFPELKNNELFAKIAELWSKHKEDKINTAKESDSESDNDKKDDDKKDDDKKDDDDKKKVSNGGKAPRKALGVKAATKKKADL
jgi:hypothetical protein